MQVDRIRRLDDQQEKTVHEGCLDNCFTVIMEEVTLNTVHRKRRTKEIRVKARHELLLPEDCNKIIGFTTLHLKGDNMTVVGLPARSEDDGKDVTQMVEVRTGAADHISQQLRKAHFP